MTEVFDCPAAESINKARLDHLASLGLDLANKTVLEVGAGIGKLTSFFEDRGCSVLSTEARQDNVKVFRDRYPKRRVEVADLNISKSHDQFGTFEIVFMYGTLYHLSNPTQALQDLSKICTGMLLLETEVHPFDNGLINAVSENIKNCNQSVTGTGCCPGRDWVMKELSKYFSQVYITKTQPNHNEYPLQWPVVSSIYNTRSIFITSRVPLENPKLQTILPQTQTVET